MTIKWGDPIECNDVRPDWLRDGEPAEIENAPGEWLEWSGCAWHKFIRAIRLPADHPAYAALAHGFHPWSGGESPPDDWDGGEVLSRGAGIFKHAKGMDWRYAHTGNGPHRGDIIGYRKRVEYGAVHTDGSRSGDTVEVRRMTEDQWRAVIMNKSNLAKKSRATNTVISVLGDLGLIRPESRAERFTRETGHAITEAVEAALNWKGE